jgi:hypothetical protein
MPGIPENNPDPKTFFLANISSAADRFYKNPCAFFHETSRITNAKYYASACTIY